MDEGPLRILLIEDDEDDYEIIKALLSEAPTLRFHLDWVTGYEAGLEAMRGREHDVCLLDYMLGARTGLEFIHELSNEANEPPIIVLTGKGTYEVDVETMRSGAADYLVKGHINADLLERSVGHTIERKCAENQATRYHQEVERLRSEHQLLQVQKAESLGRMAGAIAHHFNNKLMAVIGNLELALRFLPQESNPRTNVLRAMQASHQAVEISRLMLACVGQTHEKKEPIYLAETIKKTLSPLSTALSRNVHLITGIPLQGPIILADPVHLKQILTNLVLNASEAIGDREGDISVAIYEMSSPQVEELRVFPPEWESKAEGYACLCVSDTGCGLDAEMLEKIFDPFFSTKFIGRGLGLSVVLGLVRAYEGAIAVESRMGRGTTFQVFFPLPAVEKLPSQNDESLVSNEIEGGLSVLFIDDDPMMRDIGKDMFDLLGCEVIVASDGPEAIEIFRMRKDEVSLVVLDINMPRMNGWETLKVLRSLRPDIPAVMASGHEEDYAIRQNYPDRPQAYLQKPYRLAKLKAAIDRAKKVRLVGKKKAA
jgi:two-component system, cell cycle sensor histidine kinase and response regulator CckA